MLLQYSTTSACTLCKLWCLRNCTNMQGPIRIPSKSENLAPVWVVCPQMSSHEPVTPLYLPCDLPDLNYVVNSIHLIQTPHSHPACIPLLFSANGLHCSLLISLAFLDWCFTFQIPSFHFHWNLHFVCCTLYWSPMVLDWNASTCGFTRSIPACELNING